MDVVISMHSGRGGGGRVTTPRTPRPSTVSTIKRVAPLWWHISRLWFQSEERWRARGYAAAALLLSVLGTLLLLKVSYVQNSFQSALSEKNQAEFYSAVRSFVWVIVAAAPLFAVSQYVEGRVVIEWRRWLAEQMLVAYFADHAYYKLKLGGGLGGAGTQVLDNPDQRICDDVHSFAASSVALAVGVARKLLYCFMFGGLLLSIAPRLLWFLLCYAALGTAVTAAGFGRRLMSLTYSLLQREADLRFALVRVRENAESIAFYGGDRHEAGVACSRLGAAVGTAKARLWWEAWLGAWTNAYGYATILAPALLLAPRYFAGELRFGDISQAAYAFSRIEDALTYIVNHLAELSGLAAQTDRLDSLLSALRSHGSFSAGSGSSGSSGLGGGDGRGGGGKGGVRRVVLEAGSGIGEGGKSLGPGGGGAGGGGGSDSGGALRIERLMLYTPGGEQVLARGLDLHLTPGQSLLIVGPSGCGKSSLLRAAAGLWTQGEGIIAAPPPAATFFLPQKPYMPLGPLRQQLLFPAGVSVPVASGGWGAGGSSWQAAAGGGGWGAAAGPGGSGSSGWEAGTGTGASGGSSAKGLKASRLGSPHGSSPGSRGGASEEARSLLAGSSNQGGSVRQSSSRGGSRVASPRLLVPDSELERLLVVVRLPDLAERVGGLSAECDWSHVLSLGEQQRVAMLRLLVHAPALAFLDEATSAVDADVEHALYAALAQCCACYVSIGHRRELVDYHSHVLESEGEGRWRLSTAQEYKRRQQQRAAVVGM